MTIFSRAESLIRKREHSAVAVGFTRWMEPEMDWKKANITPIFTKGKEEAAGDCRLLSLAADPRKVMEQIPWKPHPACEGEEGDGDPAPPGLPRANCT